MTALGLTAEQVGSMTIADVLDLFAYWRHVPPVAEVVFRAAGGTPAPATSRSLGQPERSQISTDAEMQAFADLVNRR
jgi:hypothetical protein